MSNNKLFRWRVWLFPLFFISMLVAGCGDDDDDNGGAPVVTMPSITTQPANTTVTAGATATFSVLASGSAPLSYQWSRNGAAIAGATSASYTTPVTVVADSGARFSVVVTNSAGSVTSTEGVLTVTPPVTPVAPAITTQPAAMTVNAGQAATFSVVATGTAPLAYQWRRNGINLSGATGASYTTPATLASDNGTRYSVIVSNSAGQVTSNEAQLTVTVAAVAPLITQQPASTTVNPGATANFSVTATGTAPLSYQWMRSGAVIAGATSASYSTPPVTATDNGAVFTVVVTNTAGSVTSNAATLTVMSAAVAPTITRQPVGATTYEGFTAGFSVEASGTAPLSYQWRRNGANIAGATSPSYVTPTLSLANNGDRYQVVVSNAAGSVSSNEVTVTVLIY